VLPSKQALDCAARRADEPAPFVGEVADRPRSVTCGNHVGHSVSAHLIQAASRSDACSPKQPCVQPPRRGTVCARRGECSKDDECVEGLAGHASYVQAALRGYEELSNEHNIGGVICSESPRRLFMTAVHPRPLRFYIVLSIVD
jgi:hypothetical protein